MKISNLSDIQLPVDIVGANGDKDAVLLQPRGSVTLPDGFQPANMKQRYLFVHPETPAADSVGKSAKTK